VRLHRELRRTSGSFWRGPARWRRRATYLPLPKEREPPFDAEKFLMATPPPAFGDDMAIGGVESGQ